MKNTILPPVSLTSKQENFCKRLDQFYLDSHLDSMPSDKYKGAIFACRNECRNNPDWMSQAANSLREILYPFWSPRIKSSFKKAKAIKEYGAVRMNLNLNQELGRIYKMLSDITHHNKDSKNTYFDNSFAQFEELLTDFENILGDALARQIDIHQEIDEIIAIRPPGVETDQTLTSKILELINLNEDARQYFFSQANENWLGWLWKNDFLDILKQVSKDLIRKANSPESLYLVNVARKSPQEVVDIMLEIPITKEKFNSDVLERFIWICGFLPPNQLIRMIEKIYKEQWIKYNAILGYHTFDYDHMFQTLKGVSDYKNLLNLAEAILIVRPLNENENISRYFTQNPFYIDQMSDAGVFKHITLVDDGYVEQALLVSMKILSQVVLLGGNTNEKGIFKIQDLFDLSGIDFCTIEVGQKGRLYHQDFIRELAAVAKTLARRIVNIYSQDDKQAKRIYNTYIKSLPDSRLTWRLKLYVLSLNPICYKSELNNSLNRLFKVDEYFDIISGSEYENALQKGFFALNENDKRGYIEQVIKYFTQPKLNAKELKWQEYSGSRILSMITNHLTDAEKLQIAKTGLSLDASLKPESSVISRSGIIRPRGPIVLEEFTKLPVLDIVEKLRNEWSPMNLSAQEPNDDSLNPLNGEGLGKILQLDIIKRPKEYVQFATYFFERDELDLHYTYSFLSGIKEVIKNKKELVWEAIWSNIIQLFLEIRVSGLNHSFDNAERETERMAGWLANGEAIHKEIADTLLTLLDESAPIFEIFQQYRNSLVLLVEYLLSYPSPTPQDEELISAKNKIYSNYNKEYRVGDSYSLAINSVRGRSYQVFIAFTNLDSKKNAKEDSRIISLDVKNLYEDLLIRENTRALMFMFGKSLPFFYSLDSSWFRQLLPQIFTSDLTKQHLYLAAWEGYLTNDLYMDIFYDPAFQKLYERGLKLSNVKDPEREQYFDPNESIAHHFALAYLSHVNFGFENPLFKMFWAKDDPEQRIHFVRFIGRIIISDTRDNTELLIDQNTETKQRLIDLWDYLLDRSSEPDLLMHIGFWINLDKNLFSPEWLAQHVKSTLQKTNGILNWNEGLINTIEQLSRKAPVESIEIVRLYLLNGIIHENDSISFRMTDEWFNAFHILHSKPTTQVQTIALINELIQKGGQLFWKLKEILNYHQILELNIGTNQ